MFAYYLNLALRSLKRNPVLTGLMVIAIGLGIGASMTMLTVLHVMTADPIPGMSTKLFYPQLDPQSKEGFHQGDEPPDELTWADAMNLLHAAKGVRQAAMSGGQVTVVPQAGKGQPFFAEARYTSADFFAMFKLPFIAGSGWTDEEDDKQARVAVIAQKFAEKLYGTDQAVGKTLRLGKYDFRIIGVVGRWHPTPHFYDLSLGNYADSEQVFLPLQTALALQQSIMGSVSCWGYSMLGGDMRKSNDCVWMQFWVELDTAQQVTAYREFLVNYSEQQKTLGRFQRPPNTRLRNVMQWLNYNHVVPGSVQLQALLALGFLLVCLLNTLVLLLVKFLRRGGELSVRRAMGASKRAVFAQLLIESSLVGLSGGAIGLLLAGFGLWIVRQQPVDYAAVAHLDPTMLMVTFLLAVVTTLLAALFPAWRACRLMPARLLKLQ